MRAAMFDSLSSGLEKAWDIVRKDGQLTPGNVKGPMREIRRALLEADVSLPACQMQIRLLRVQTATPQVVPLTSGHVHHSALLQFD